MAAAAGSNFFSELDEFQDDEIREIRILFAIDPPSPKGPARLLDYLADNELLILKKVLLSMNESRFRIKIKEQRNLASMICSRCGKPFKKNARAKA